MKFFNFLQLFFFTQKLKFIKKKSKILVLDIDNTIADTWPLIKEIRDSKINNFYLFSNIAPIDKTINYLRNKYSNVPIVFLSNRNIVYYNTTRKWLLKNGFSQTDFHLILTMKVTDKIYYLKLLQSISDKIIYYDDLSFNHENGVTKFYQDVIDTVLEMNVEYYGYNNLLEIKNSANENIL